ncbi:MAG: DUF4332 domain-containing protein [Gammaproteobacteria bacterium]|nr:DUF4332 domain-containing protein [Gammaproteobacteria bacterium]NND55064.1 DUF4332 domain-containing protein [Gammaproteobacteria bacterium]
MSKLETIEGVGPAITEKLEKAGIKSCESLLEKGATKKGRSEIAGASGISDGQILKFVNHADLMRIKGIGGEYSELLECAGVDSVPELAQRNAANLTEKMASVNAEKKLVRALPSEKQVTDWVKQAGSLDKIVTH